MPSQSLAIPDLCCKFRGNRLLHGGKSYAEGVKNNFSTYKRRKSDFWNTFLKDPGNTQILPEHSFSGSKALLLSRKSIASLQMEHCSALKMSVFFTKKN